MPQEHLRILTHDGASESISLIGPQIVMFIPTSADQFFKVIARIYSLVFRRKVVEDLGGSMHACWCEADACFGMGLLRTIHWVTVSESLHC